MLAEIYPGPASEVDAALRSLGVRAYLGPASAEVSGAAVNHRYFAFGSSGVCEIIYGLMLFTQRQRLHTLAAGWYERLYSLTPGGTDTLTLRQLAFHATRGGEVDLAKWTLRAAGRATMRQGEYVETERHLSACVEAFAAELEPQGTREGGAEVPHVPLGADGRVDPIYVEVRVALAGLWSEFSESGAAPPAGVAAFDALEPLLEALEQQYDAEGAARRSSSPGRDERPARLLRTSSSLGGSRLSGSRTALSNAGGETALQLAQVCHAASWARLVAAVPGWADAREL